MSAPGWQLPEGKTTWRVCRHLLEDAGKEPEYCRRLTGIELDYDLVCPQCRSTTDESELPLVVVSPSQFSTLEEAGYWEYTVGEPGIRTRLGEIRFSHTLVQLGGGVGDDPLAIQPISDSLGNQWIALSPSGLLQQLDLDGGTCTPRSAPDLSALDLSQPIMLLISPHSEQVVIANKRGAQGVLVDLVSGNTLLQLQRDDYHVQHCSFPLAFFELEGRVLLVHGTAWNRLDISDPRTGELLTAREPTSYLRGEPRPEHYLDYFHGRLTVSPDGRWIADDGWIWHPFGQVRCWNLERWVRENQWESEDGTTLKQLAGRAYFWDGPVCWLDNHRLAIWGYGDDDYNLLPAALIYDLNDPHPSEMPTRWFAGPRGTFVFDEYLFASSPEHGTSVWDVETGERLLLERDLNPDGYHRGARAFVTALSGGKFKVSRLISEMPAPQN